MKAMLKNARFPVTSLTNRGLVRPVALNKFPAAATASVSQHWRVITRQQQPAISTNRKRHRNHQSTHLVSHKSHHLGCSVVSAYQLICTIPSGCFLKITSKIKIMSHEPKNSLNQVSRNDPSSMVALLALVRAQILNPLPNSEADGQAPRVHQQHLDFDHLKPPIMLHLQHLIVDQLKRQMLHQ